MTRHVSVLLAGGGTAGHIDAAAGLRRRLRRLEPGMRITALGTSRGLEAS